MASARCVSLGRQVAALASLLALPLRPRGAAGGSRRGDSPPPPAPARPLHWASPGLGALASAAPLSSCAAPSLPPAGLWLMYGLAAGGGHGAGPRSLPSPSTA